MTFTKVEIDNELNLHQELWLQALESGDYEQSFNGYMHSVVPGTKKHVYCPLGVACAILDKNLNPQGASLSHPERDYDKRSRPAPCMSKLNLTVEGESLIQALNDQVNLPFQLLSETIRSRPYKYFSNFSLPEQP